MSLHYSQLNEIFKGTWDTYIRDNVKHHAMFSFQLNCLVDSCNTLINITTSKPPDTLDRISMPHKAVQVQKSIILSIIGYIGSCQCLVLRKGQT